MPDSSSANPAPKKIPSGDTAQYIRTYAKDVALLTNQPVPASKKEDTGGVTFSEVDASPVNRPDGIAKAFPQEVLNVTKEDSKDVFAVRPNIAPQTPPAPTDAERREEVLARLRQKVAASPPLPPPQPPPPPPVPAPAPLPEASPAPLHTYTSDFADHIDQERASTFSVLAAQQDAGAYVPKAKPRKRKGVLSTFIALFLLLGGMGGVYWAYRYALEQNAVPETLGVPSLIFADEKTEIEGPDYMQSLADAAGQPLVEGNILVTYVTEASSTPLGMLKDPQPGGILIRLLNLGAPDILMRNVDLTSTVGIIAAGGQTRPFFILRVNSYERTFAGMLGWEPRIEEDLALLYPRYAEMAPVPTATTTAATSTPTYPAPREFTDAVVANRDVRKLMDRSGRTLMLYGYSDKQTLLIARDEAAFAALVARLSATREE